ncbi:DNA-directed RNA polymerase III subunit RPC7 [Alligator mississippiensis]|uniref:DNA-directed RNA polymerase III subunit RPC7 n=1 Tax=Alligator mississippiensis TaxID=8496 RepID=A0A151PIA4_ALLMI|nr:DNA-directed RNA polymerase III subunit RPC7 [Alligator mississippiensis]
MSAPGVLVLAVALQTWEAKSMNSSRDKRSTFTRGLWHHKYFSCWLNPQGHQHLLGEALPEAAFKPPPLFPSTDCKPVPLKTGEDEEYMLALKQELRGTMKKMPYFMPVEEEHEAIEKYSQKYQQLSKERTAWTPDWRRLPREIKLRKKIKKALWQNCEPDPSTAVRVAGRKPKKAKVDAKVDANKSNVDVLKKIEGGGCAVNRICS